MGKPNLKYGESNTQRYLVRESGHNPKCFYCGREFVDTMDGYQNMSIDHRKSKHKERDDSVENLVLCCKSCNSSKGKRSFPEGGPGIELQSFQKYRERMRIADDLWVKNHLFEFSKLQKFPDSEAIIEDLFKIMNDNNKFEGVEYYKNKKQWLHWKSHNIEFFFRPQDFIFQPIIEKNSIDDTLKRILYALGFYPEDQWGVIKYIKPFCDPKTGIEIICTEIDTIAKIINL